MGLLTFEETNKRALEEKASLPAAKRLESGAPMNEPAKSFVCCKRHVFREKTGVRYGRIRLEETSGPGGRFTFGLSLKPAGQPPWRPTGEAASSGIYVSCSKPYCRSRCSAIDVNGKLFTICASLASVPRTL